MSNTVRIYQRYLIGSAVPFGSQANVSPECLVCVFLMDKEQIISIKEDEPVQLLLSCLFWVVFFPRSLDLFITSHLSGSLAHIRGLFFIFSSALTFPVRRRAGMMCPDVCHAGGLKICCL